MALHLVTDFYFYAGVLGGKVAKVHSPFIDALFNLPGSFCKGGTMGRFQCRERSDFRRILPCILTPDPFPMVLLKSGLGILLGNTAGDM